MAIVQRSLVYAAATGDIEVQIKLHAPLEGEADWSCVYEIGWPDGLRRGYGYGVDATQAVLLALQGIGTDIDTSDYHRSGRLRWERPGGGYGYPVPRTIRDLLIGEDAKSFG